MGYRLWAEDIGTEFRATHIKRSSGVLECDLAIATTMPGIKTVNGNGNLHQARFNMSSSQTRSSLAKTLDIRAQPVKIDWGILLEELCQRTMALEAIGEPIVRVGTAASNRIAGSYALDPLVPRNVSALLYGPGGAGKSMLALAGLLSIAVGREIIPGIPPAIKGPGLYLDWETDQDVVNDRIQTIARGAGFAPVDVHYRRCRKPLAADAEEIAQFVAAEGIVYMVVDAAEAAKGSGHEYGDANEGTLRLFEATRLINVSTQIIDHVSKQELRVGGRVRGLSPYGSVFKTNQARATWELRNSGSPDEEQLRISLLNTKANDRRKHANIDLLLDWKDENLATESLRFLPDTAPAEREPRQRGNSIGQAIMAILEESTSSDSGKTAPEITDLLQSDEGIDTTPATVRMELRRLSVREVVQGEGGYGGKWWRT